MSNLQANRTLSGSFAEVWVDGARIAELSQLTLTIKVQREKVQFGMDVDSKITGLRRRGHHDPQAGLHPVLRGAGTGQARP